VKTRADLASELSRCVTYRAAMLAVSAICILQSVDARMGVFDHSSIGSACEAGEASLEPKGCPRRMNNGGQHQRSPK
jgi:hypothetical protein